MMRAIKIRSYWPAAAGLALLLMTPAGPLQAQEEERGRIEIGIRHIFGDPNSSKFAEYRSIPKGLYIQRFELKLNNLLDDKYYFGYQARETLEKDQSHLLSAGAHGKYKMQLRWDQTPHNFTNMASSFFTELTPGVFTVPRQIRTTLETTPSLLSDLLQQARPLNVSLRRETGSGTFTFMPTARWDFEVGYSREKQTGSRPIGTTTNSFTNVVELPEPIDYRTRQLKAGAEYSGRDWGLQATYLASIFKNNVGELVWDNPFRSLDTATAGSRGRLDLYPGNSAQNLNIAGAVNLRKDTRFVGGFGRGWMRQDDAFLPFTINPAIASVPALPASSLDGRKQTLALNSMLTSDIIPSLSLTARYRSFDYANDTPSLAFTNYVRTDAGLNEGRRNLPYAYDQRTAGVDAVWTFDKRNALRFGYEWEQFEREFREVNRSTENTFGGSVDLNPVSRIVLRASYRRSDREPERYHPNEESYLVHNPLAIEHLDELRKFDQAQRI
ncbi:MAG: MtrB/PioB family outer membrane beta-barrel protein, partial [Acidobacteria bacterium]|nr:MtrB/PioB family outer membrane beta-barrel protein [Acidobacteriota bacterium]